MKAKARPRRDDTVEMHQLLRGSKRTRQAGGMFSAGGFAWRRTVVVASSGVDGRRRMDTSGTN